MRRIVFSIAFFRKKLSVQSTPTSTKSRWKFSTQVGHQSFHTAWGQKRKCRPVGSMSALPRKADIAEDCCHSVWWQIRKSLLSLDHVVQRITEPQPMSILTCSCLTCVSCPHLPASLAICYVPRDTIDTLGARCPWTPIT